MLLLRRSRVLGATSVRIGKRSISEALGKGTRSSRGSYRHITDKLQALELAGFIRSDDTNRLGTAYAVCAPREVPSIRERLEAEANVSPSEADHFRDPERRKALFERDRWRCRYCGRAVSPEDATLDHVVPQHAGGAHSAENLATSCLMCNSIKSGRTYEEAAPLILERLRSTSVGQP